MNRLDRLVIYRLAPAMEPHLQQPYYHGPVPGQNRPGYHQHRPRHDKPQSTLLDDFSAAEVLASFNKYPIKATAFDSSHNSRNTNFTSTSESEAKDPLLADIQSVAYELNSALPRVLSNRQFPDEDADCDLNLSYCRGAIGTGGSLVPEKPDRDPGLSYATPVASPVTTHPPEPAMKSEPPPATSAGGKRDQGFKTSFQFVVNEDAREARNTVRKHVMKEYRRRERWEQDKKQAGPEAPRSALKRRRKSSKPSTGSDTSVSEEGLLVSPLSSEIGEQAGGSGTTETALALPMTKRRRFMPPVFAESRQAQLWGAVNFDYENAMDELKGGKTLPYQSDPWAAVAPSDIDPFSKLNHLGPATQSLLHHCKCHHKNLSDN